MQKNNLQLTAYTKQDEGSFCLDYCNMQADEYKTWPIAKQIFLNTFTSEGWAELRRKQNVS